MSYSTKSLQSQCIKSVNSIGTKIKNVYEGPGMLNLGNQGFDIIQKKIMCSSPLTCTLIKVALESQCPGSSLPCYIPRVFHGDQYTLHAL